MIFGGLVKIVWNIQTTHNIIQSAVNHISAEQIAFRLLFGSTIRSVEIQFGVLELLWQKADHIFHQNPHQQIFIIPFNNDNIY